MKQWLKASVRQALRKRGKHLIATPPGQVTGIHLDVDLPVLITSISPVIFDVGANVGQTAQSLLAAFKHPKIFSFEPSSTCVEQFKKFIASPSVVIRQCAVGSNIGTCELDVYEETVFNSVLPFDQAAENRFRDQRPKGKETVPLTTLDSLVGEYKLDRLDLLKIDTQGFDLEVLKGGKNLFHRRAVGLVQVELNFVPIYRNQASASSVTHFLNDQGFVLIDYYEKFRQDHALAWCTALFKHRDLDSQDSK